MIRSMALASPFKFSQRDAMLVFPSTCVFKEIKIDIHMQYMYIHLCMWISGNSREHGVQNDDRNNNYAN